MTHPRTRFRPPLPRGFAPLAGAALLALASLVPSGFAQESAHPIHLGQGRSANRPEVPGVYGLVTAGHPLASMAGIRILMDGGNAMDASVAVLAVLHVVRPQMSGAAGNGFLTYFDRASGTVHSLSATGAAPAALDAASLTPDELNKGIMAGAVPGLFGGWISALERHGTMRLEEVLAPAVDYAKKRPSAGGVGGARDPLVRGSVPAFPDQHPDVPAGGPGARNRRALPNARPRAHPRKAGGGGEERPRRGKEPRGGAPGRLRPLLLRRHRGGDGPLLPRERRAVHDGGLRRLPPEVDRGHPHHLPRLRGPFEPAHLPRRTRSPDAAQPDRRLRAGGTRPELAGGAPSGGGGDPGRQVRCVPVCGRPVPV